MYEIIILKDKLWLKRQKKAGYAVIQSHQEIFRMIKSMASFSLQDLGKIVHDILLKNNCTPTFFNYKNYPCTICTSLNNELVHGFTRDITLQSGDILKVDIGATFEGAIADCAFTYTYGNVSDDIKKMLVSCYGALYDGINEVKVGNRIGKIGGIIWEKGKRDGFGVIDQYGGHGLGYNLLHGAPFVSNKSSKNSGIRIQPGISIAIEPMFVLGNNTKTKVLKDKWTVVTKGIGCHYEHSVTLDEGGDCHIITEHNLKPNDLW